MSPEREAYPLWGSHDPKTEAECDNCLNRKTLGHMVFVGNPNGDYGWYCSWKCAADYVDSESFLSGEREARR